MNKNTNSQNHDHKTNQLSKDIPAPPAFGNQPEAPLKQDETPNEKPAPQVNVQASKHVENGHIPNAAEVQAEKRPGKKQGKVFKAGSYFLRTKAKHPRRQFQIGRHAIGPGFEAFELNEAEAKELGTEGPQAWVEIGDEKKAKADAKLFKEMDFKNLDKQSL